MDSSYTDLVMFNSQGQHDEGNMSRLPWKRERSNHLNLSPDEDEELANCLVLLSNSGNAYKNERKTVKKQKTAHVFQCKGCKKVFASHQALGGHRASHKKVKGCFASQDKKAEEEEEEEYKEEEDEEEEEEEDKPHITTRKRSNVHECTICHRVFSSGQALGGHKRCHWLTPSTNYLRMKPLNDSSTHHHHSQPLDQPSLDLNLACVDPTVMTIGRDGGGSNHNATTSSNSWLKLASERRRFTSSSTSPHFGLNQSTIFSPLFFSVIVLPSAMARGSGLHALFAPKPQRTKSKLATSLARAINSSDQVESSLSSLQPLSLSTTTVLQTLRLITHPPRALRFFDYLSTTTSFSHTPHSFFLMLHLLSQSRNLNAARNFLFSIEKRSNGSVKLHPRFFNTLIKSYADAGLLHESLSLFHTMKEMSITPSPITFNTLLSILLKRGKTGMALDLFHEMRRTYGVSPDAYTFNILINGFCKNSMVAEAFRVFKDMRFDPDLVTYNTIIDGLCRAGKVNTARNVLNGMVKRGVVPPNVVSYTTLVRGYCMKHEVDKALALFREIDEPNDVSFNTLIKGLSEARRFDEIKEVLRASSAFAPDRCTFNVLIKAHCDGGDLDEAVKVFGEMERPDSASYSVLIRALCLRQEFGRAERLFDELYEKGVLLEKGGSKPIAAAYNLMFEYLCANGKTKRAERVFRQLMKIGAQDPASYGTLIMGHCREGGFKGGYELLVLMLRREFVPDFEIYELLIDGLLKTGEALLAHDVLERMMRSSYLPVAATFHCVLEELVRRGFANECFDLVRIMLEKRVRQNVDLATDVVRLLFSSGRKDKAFVVVRLVYENGYLVKMEELIDFLCENRKLVDSAHRLVLFCLENNQMVDISRWNRVIEGLCKRKRHSEAFGLFNELVEIGKHQELSCHVVLRNALEAAGKLEEVRFVSKRMAVSDDCSGLKQGISS
uniref:C2H2-type domain-containing protein n=1 Tax=Brassica campestris TaxID=3711 RepID=A0A3P6CRH8_BRACM|nr:unnamed protein product [Brassica rapa]